MDSSFFSLIHNVAMSDMQDAGVDKEDVEKRAEYLMRTRRTQIWTFEHIAGQAQSKVMRDMFLELAQGVRDVPEMDLIMGEPGASGSVH